MNSDSRSIDAARLLEHVEGIRRLAKRLLRDEDAADDVAQETLLIALRSQPSIERPHAWLNAIVRHVARGFVRTERRRAERETRAAQPEVQPSTFAAVERVSEQRRVLGAVLDLEDTYRTVVVLRFFEDLPPREIARRLDVPVETVRTRLKRACATLRERLRDEHGGDDRAWRLAILPLLAVKAKSGTAGIPGGLIVATTAKIASVAAAVILAILAIVFWHSSPSPKLESTAGASRSRFTAAPTVAASPNVDAAKTPASSPVADAPASSPEASAKPPASESKVRLSGTIVVTDSSGAEYSLESGTFEISASDGYTMPQGSATVERGSWSTTIARRPELTIFNIRLGGRAAVWDDDGRWVPFPESGVLEIRAHWPKPTMLHVRSAADRRELDDVELVAGPPPDNLCFSHPGPFNEDAVFGRALVSPIRLNDRVVGNWPGSNNLLGRSWIFARCRGFGWGRAEIDLATGGDVFIDLRAGGDLEITFTGPGNRDHCCLRLWSGESTEGMPWGQFPIPAAPRLTIDSVPAGHGVVRALLGDFGWTTPVLASADVDVVAGSTTTVSLVLGARPEVRKVALAGTVRVPRALAKGHMQIGAVPLATPLDGSLPGQAVALISTQSDDDSVIYPFEFKAVQPGRYKLQLEQPPAAFFVDVGDEGKRDIDLVVPEPAHVIVEVVDAVTAEPIPEADAAWTGKPPGDATNFSGMGIQRTDPSRPFEFDAPQTEIEIRCSALGYDGASQPVLVTEGTNRLVVRLARLFAIVLRVRDGDVDLAWRSDWHISPGLGDTGGQRRGYSDEEKSCRFWFTKPGRYRFAFPKVDGYEPVPEQEVVVDADHVNEHVIHLVREH
ncbi:MAG: sigma-70 family RNA polymerase sigma factor [Planctomycetes bacterium]|nr:sigma-70 family RNA polymerase sigma factor [Planctomycetota bacterium]MBI3846620.1 sigma-70 family RNA polymerase sigma factor [Planctomycetota bacterium]